MAPAPYRRSFRFTFCALGCTLIFLAPVFSGCAVFKTAGHAAGTAIKGTGQVVSTAAKGTAKVAKTTVKGTGKVIKSTAQAVTP